MSIVFDLENNMTHNRDFQAVPLGTYDVFKDATSWDEETSRQWIDALNRRSAAPDQIKLRARLLELTALRQGDTAVEIGCGTGALLCDLASTVSPGGRVIGVEPQTALAQAAIRRLRAAGYESVSEILCESAQLLPLASESADACLAQTVLIHLPDNILQHTLIEMIRVVRHGGRVISVDQDGDTWVLDHPDRELTRRIVRFNSDQRYADGWTGRKLRRYFRQAGLGSVEVHVWPHTDTDSRTYLFDMATRLAKAAADIGVITSSERDTWLTQLEELALGGHFFSSINFYASVGIRA